ncbi:MAG: hypothetical protein NDI61_08255 [Bdellovibrionaceae bacterium]|nr:hypothetical protein [Pseudobdellovibrionaceae bacterium]
MSRTGILGSRSHHRPIRIAAVLSAAIVFFTSPARANDADVIASLTAQNHRVLSGRFHEILEYRIQAIAKCDIATHVSLGTRYRALTASSPDRADAVATLQLYRDTYLVNEECRTHLARAEARFHRLERRLFRPLTGLVASLCKTAQEDGQKEIECRSRLMQVLADLDPNCIRVQVDNPTGEYDTFPCMAGDYRIARDLTSAHSVAEVVAEVKLFLQNVRVALVDTSLRADGLDLYDTYLGSRPDTAVSRQRFLSIWVLLNASTHSLTSYMQGYHHHFARETLFRTGSPDEAVTAFVSSRLLTDEYRTLFRWIREKRIPLRIHEKMVGEMNRHDYMAAFLACRYRHETKAIRERLPTLLGYTYESFDFLSHLKEGDSLEVAWGAFREDTRRYRAGVRWGHSFCAAPSASSSR